MSEKGPKGPYVYQPFGTLTHPSHNKVGRLYGVGGVHVLTRIEGLTKDEAEAVVEALSEPLLGYYCKSCGHRMKLAANYSHCSKCGERIKR